MAKLIFVMSQSLDGYVAAVDGALEPPLHGPPDAALFRHFTELVTSLAGSLYGRRMYETMRYWDEDQPGWDAREREFASAWRAQPKWVASRSHKELGPNATLVDRDVEAFARTLKSEVGGIIAVAGPELAATLTKAGLIDEYHLYVRPFVLSQGKPYFADTRPALRFISADRVGEDAVRLIYERA
ncbi:MAG TPA: dihydrofolate reductase family protein [Candidatus Acidoferrales bacterium]|nr:dihydrofolate reductase family protein [Candidatus Acidoferrales bacterium]